ncbi:MAG: hypothetical protein MJ147_08590 [Clostridia bacterium]|nr:hypothetical protein [Clostridia bacterium]
MTNGKVKATILKSVSALLCTAILACSGIANTNKICETKLKINGGANSTVSEKTSSDEVNEQFFDEIADVEDNSEAPVDEETESAEEYTIDDSNDSAPAQQAGDSSSSTSTSKPAKEEKKKISLIGGLSSNNKEEVLEYYKLVSKKNANLLFTKTLTFIDMRGGKNMPQRMIDIFLPIAQKALDKNTVNDEPYPGKPDKILPSDWQAAKAVNDGTYTTIYVKVQPQTDGYNGKKYEGSCGRSMCVLDGIDQALAEMNAVSVDFSQTKMVVNYVNPIIKLKVKNSTGELVKGGCEWSYRTNPEIDYMEAKFLTFKIHIEAAGGNVDYSVKY